MRRSVPSLMALALLLAIAPARGAEAPTLEDLAAAIERVWKGPDGERIVVGYISRKLGVSVEALRAQRGQAGVGWGEVLIAGLLSKETKLTFDQVVAEFRSGKPWADIARNHRVDLDKLTKDVQQSEEAMEQRAEDRAPRSETLSSPGGSTSAPSGPLSPSGPLAPSAPASKSPIRRY